MLLPDDLLRMADTGVIVIVGTRDADRVPEVTRGWGVRVLPESEALEICVSSRVCGRTLANLAHNQQIAVTITSPRNYRSFQVKGVAGETGDRKLPAKERRLRRAVDLAAVAHLGEQRTRHA